MSHRNSHSHSRPSSASERPPPSAFSPGQTVRLEWERGYYHVKVLKTRDSKSGLEYLVMFPDKYTEWVSDKRLSVAPPTDRPRARIPFARPRNSAPRNSTPETSPALRPESDPYSTTYNSYSQPNFTSSVQSRQPLGLEQTELFGHHIKQLIKKHFADISKEHEKQLGEAKAEVKLLRTKLDEVQKHEKENYALYTKVSNSLIILKDAYDDLVADHQYTQREWERVKSELDHMRGYNLMEIGTHELNEMLKDINESQEKINAEKQSRRIQG